MLFVVNKIDILLLNSNNLSFSCAAGGSLWIWSETSFRLLRTWKDFDGDDEWLVWLFGQYSVCMLLWGHQQCSSIVLLRSLMLVVAKKTRTNCGLSSTIRSYVELRQYSSYCVCISTNTAIWRVRTRLKNSTNCRQRNAKKTSFAHLVINNSQL